jgi:hypothetical protein
MDKGLELVAGEQQHTAFPWPPSLLAGRLSRIPLPAGGNEDGAW